MAISSSSCRWKARVFSLKASIEFGFVSQLAAVTENTKRGARGLILPPSTELCNPAEGTLLAGTITELERLGVRPRDVAVDGAFKPAPTNTAFAGLQPRQVFIAGRQESGSKRTTRRMRRNRTGHEGRISHLKRRYGLDRPRLTKARSGPADID
jgi:transposase, IS5 family